MVREKGDREKEPLLQREIRDDFHGSTTASLSSADYDTYIKPYIQTETAVYWYRWYILALFTCIAMMSNIGWNTWGPIETSARATYGWSKSTISLLANWGAFTFVIAVFPSSYILDRYGLRVSTLIAITCLCFGTGVRCITPDPKYATPLIHCGQIMIGFAGPVAQAAATALSSVWFPSNQRTTATAVASLASYCGTALSFLTGPSVVEDFGDYPISEAHSKYKALVDKISKDIMHYLYVQAGVCGVLFILVVFTFPKKPPKPPSATATLERMNFKEGLKKLFFNPQFQLIAFAYGLTTGVYSAWCSDLAINLKSFNINDKTAGFLGFWAVIAGSISGISLSLMADKLGALKLLIILLFVVATGGFAVFSLICVNIVPTSMALFYLTSVVGGLCLNGSIPLFFELAVESSYPVAEGINTGAMTFSNNIYCLIFLSLPLIPNLGTAWMNWFLVGSCVVCVPTMLMFKERYRRLELDMVEGNTTNKNESTNSLPSPTNYNT
ncbi:solute carrier family 49 member 4-like [Clytia hemisphaerica]|uniref:Uncharacterized protein n=1 Tax=Clytia hemisphaerica TaxID=252671 RepID=A0A7M5ULG2_9CNID